MPDGTRPLSETILPNNHMCPVAFFREQFHKKCLWTQPVTCVLVLHLHNYYHTFQGSISLLQWRHNEHDSVSNHQPYDCFLNLLFRQIWKKISELRVTGLCEGKFIGDKRPVTQRMLPFYDVIMINIWIHCGPCMVQNVLHFIYNQ